MLEKGGNLAKEFKWMKWIPLLLYVKVSKMNLVHVDKCRKGMDENAYAHILIHNFSMKVSSY